ncbi:carcinoembryonic antigen-related cell adhesion molecule 21 [Nematolebias whitei]|uniref:carcinoembryonic antigen-related cell adhesion molecule 21 n=1 Tax=Nematolebias whitei TaxID=451745 RepID=UPI00189AE8DE|nr:carcinoembryonic antigen-related cell adhesion molecule 21 [Nematolebias whitei]
MEIRSVLVLLAAVLNAVLADVKYFEVGGAVSLKPNTPSEGINVITWKHGGDIVADWIKGGTVEYYGAFKSRTTLDLSSGVLTLGSMSKADEGDFTVEVNNRVQSVVYSAKQIKSLLYSNVEVLKRPLTCNHLLPKCTLSCITDNTDGEPFQYFWKEGDGEWMEFTKDKEIINNDQIKTFSCNISNPISSKKSDPLDNPFIKQPDQPVSLVVGIVFLVILVLAGAALAGFAYKYPKRLAPCIPCVAGDRNERPTEGPAAEDKDVALPLTN